MNTETPKESPLEITHSETIKKKCISLANFSINAKSLSSSLSSIEASSEPFIIPELLASSIA